MIAVLVEAALNLPVDLVIVNYRSYEELSRCLTCLDPARGAVARVTVIDHESDPAAAACIRAEHPWVDFVGRDTNEGFASGVNLGARRGSSPFLLLLNPDCVAGHEAIEQLVRYGVTRTDAAVIGPRILNPDESIQGSARRFPGWSTFIAGRSSWLTRHFPRNPLSRWNLPALAEVSGPIDVDWVSGACMLVRRSAFESVAGMDERFFLYWEDADLCKRLAARGWRTVYFPPASIQHAGGRSSIHAYRESLAAFHTSAFKMFRKHASLPMLALAPVLYLMLQIRLRLLLFLHRDRLSPARLTPPEHPSRA
jgi:GT2 family glycosyltransferase